MHIKTLIPILLAGLATASASPLHHRAALPTAEAQLLHIAPLSVSCASAPFPSECATASTAAPFLIAAMSSYSITSAPELAALLSLIAFETGDFRYDRNHYPGRPGQGTRNMQMGSFNLEYARAIPELATGVAQIAGSRTAEQLSDAEINAVRELVLDDKYSWASAAWFYVTKCGGVRAEVQKGGQEGFEAYMQCVGVQATADRLEYWKRAKEAFGIA